MTTNTFWNLYCILHAFRCVSITYNPGLCQAHTRLKYSVVRMIANSVFIDLLVFKGTE